MVDRKKNKSNSESRHLLRQLHQTNCCILREVIFFIHLFFMLNQYFLTLNYIFLYRIISIMLNTRASIVNFQNDGINR
jgi:hypothetical protein